MAEQRLIDANALREDWLENGENEYVYDTNSFLCSLDDASTVDPETLPIVKQLRAELERVTAERDKIAQYELDACGEYCFGDSSTGIPECEWLDSNGRCKLKEWVKENTAGKGDGLNESAQETAGERLP